MFALEPRFGTAYRVLLIVALLVNAFVPTASVTGLQSKPKPIPEDTKLNSAASTTVSLDFTLSTGSDDAEESSSGVLSLDSSDLELVRDGSNQQVGIRFTDVNIPQGAAITNAYIQFRVDETNSEATTLTIKGEAIDHAPTFTTTSHNISARARSTSSVTWSPTAWNTVNEAGANQRTPDLSAIIQETVDRPGWASGNALAILITG